MKKFLTIVAALALVLGLSQCKKPNVPEYTGPIGDRYLQHITVGATNGIGNNGNSKVAVDPDGPNMNLTWEANDQLHVFRDGTKVSTNPLVLSEGATTSKGKFGGEILAGEGDKLTFIYKGSEVELENDGTFEIEYNDQTGTLKWLKNHLVLKADNVPFTPNVSDYNATLTAPYAIVFLDLSSFGKTKKDGVDVTIKKGENPTPIATVKGVTTASNKMYVVMPVDNTEQTYTLDNGNGRTVKYTWTLAGCNYYTAAGTGGGAVTDCFCFTAKQANSTVSMAKVETGGTAPTVTLEYSINGTAWNTFTVGTTVTLEKEGDKVYFRAGDGGNKKLATLVNPNPIVITYNYFVTTGDLSVGGNIMYLLDGTTPATTLDTDNTCCFSYLFFNCTAISDFSQLQLPATELADYCYYYMFQKCTGLETAPALPATALADYCYHSMFRGCTGLKTAPALQATELADRCYCNMFYDCTGLKTAPALPATELADRCYYSMFQGCTELSSAPALPATTLASFCYRSMFQGCTKLTTAPELKATALQESCYLSMFQNCTNLTTAPELKATTLAKQCYQGMFYGCTKLSSVTMLATSVSATSCLQKWLENAGSDASVTSAKLYVDKNMMTNTTITNSLPSQKWSVAAGN